MFFKERPLITILLLIVIISFAFLASIKNSYSVIEGNTNLGDEEPVPDCADDVPACYSTLVYDTNNASYEAPKLDDDFILKTQIVPPVCPACPSVINQHSHDGSAKQGNSLSGSDISMNETNITNITNEENISNNYNETIDVSQEINKNVSDEDSSKNDDKTKSQDNTNQLGAIMNDMSSFTVSGSSPNQKDDSRLKEYEKQISELKGKLSALQQKTNTNGNGECPPCPACDRCPEPVFSCEKVVNYRSPSLGQYLPMPVLGDFSTFKE
jgi:hypothetical protein